MQIIAFDQPEDEKAEIKQLLASGRVGGYQQALIFHGLEYDKDLILYTDYTNSATKDMILNKLSTRKDITAVIAELYK